MLRKVIIFLFSVMLLILGSWLTGTLDSNPEIRDVSAYDLLRSFIGLLLVLGAVIGIGFVLIGGPRQLTPQERTGWAKVRLKGRFVFIRDFLVKIFPVIFASVSLPVLWDFSAGHPVAQDIKIYAVIGIVLLGCAGFIANAIWNSNEIQLRLSESTNGDKELPKDKPPVQS
jgi:hypothetical protein